MKKDAEGQGAYVRKVRDETQRYIQNLLEENEKLRALGATLQSEKLRLQEQVLALREELHSHQMEQVRLQRELAEIDKESRRYSKEFVQVEEQNSNLANLYVASYRLHSTVDRQEVLAVIQEVIVNLVGSEQIAIFEVDSKRSMLSLVASHGIDPARYQTIHLGSGLIGRAAFVGKAYLAGEQAENNGAPEEADLTACIPLKVDGKVTGAIAVFRLLPQKTGIEELDRELFDLLATHAATALYCTGLHAKLGASVGVTA